MKAILSLLRKDFQIFTRFKASIVITFVVPIVLIYIFGFVFGLNRKDSGPSGIPLAIVNQSSEPAAEKLIQALRDEKALFVITTAGPKKQPHPLTEAEARQALTDNDYRFVLILPPDLVSSDSIGLHVRYLNNPRNEIEAQTVNGLIQKAIFSKVPQLLTQSMQLNARKTVGTENFSKFHRKMADNIAATFGGNSDELYKKLEAGDYFNIEETAKATKAPADSTLRRLDTPAAPAAESTDKAEKSEDTMSKLTDFFSKIVKIDREQVAGKNVKNPAAARLIGGYAVMFLLFAVSGFSTSFFGEKSTGIFSRILATSATRTHIILSKFLFCILLGVSQIMVLYVFGNLMYQLDLYAHIVPLLLVTVCVSAACASFGMLIAALASNPHSANGLATFLVLTMSAVGGAWFPISFMPSFMQVLSKFTVVYWSVEGLTNILWADFGIVQSLPTIGILLLITSLAMGFSLWRFNKGNLFE